MNFSLSPADSESVLGGHYQGQLAALPVGIRHTHSSSQYEPLHLAYGRQPTTTPLAIMSAITGDRRRTMPYSGTIVPGYNVEGRNEHVRDHAAHRRHASIHGWDVEHGALQRAAFVGLPVRRHRRHIGSGNTVYPSGGANSWRSVFVGTTAVGASTSSIANNTALTFAQGCNSIPGTSTSTYSDVVGVQIMAGNPGYPVLTSYMHWTAPNTAPCANSGEANTALAPGTNPFGVGPYGSASANSMHSGGVNVCFADGSVHFIKTSVACRPGGGSAPVPAAK